uniref:peptidylprolyl isomerase n=1 Tax=Astyanax mexicanus TaxID=7994 RepID=A0A3B1J0A5_ASTMX
MLQNRMTILFFRGEPHWFVLGVGEVIKGLDLGLKDMCPGEKRKITVPPSLAFGAQGKHPVPPNSTVIFEVGAAAHTARTTQHRGLQRNGPQ